MWPLDLLLLLLKSLRHPGSGLFGQLLCVSEDALLLFTRKQKQFCAQQAIGFSLVFCWSPPLPSPARGEQRVVQPVGLTGHHPFNVEWCFSLKAKNKCY